MSEESHGQPGGRHCCSVPGDGAGGEVGQCGSQWMVRVVSIIPDPDNSICAY